MADRTCGDCTLCCKIVGVTEIAKPPRKWCQHCDIGKSCLIYDDRPRSCAVFECFWYSNTWIPDRLRPDRSKVVLEGMMEANAVLVMCDSDRPDAWLKQPMHSFLERLVHDIGMAVLIDTKGPGTTPRVWLPPGRSMADLIDGIGKTASNIIGRYAAQEGIHPDTALRQLQEVM